MSPFARRLAASAALLFTAACSDTSGPHGPAALGRYDVRRYGARGDGVALDTAAVNAAIAAAADAGGGTVVFPAGRYACHSVHLRSHVTLDLGAGATLAAAPPTAAESYDPPEPNPFDPYEDFGHSHFHNSLIWGENLTDVAIVGPGTIDGSHGLARGTGTDPSEVGAGVGYRPAGRTPPPRPPGHQRPTPSRRTESPTPGTPSRPAWATRRSPSSCAGT